MQNRLLRWEQDYCETILNTIRIIEKKFASIKFNSLINKNMSAKCIMHYYFQRKKYYQKQYQYQSIVGSVVECSPAAPGSIPGRCNFLTNSHRSVESLWYSKTKPHFPQLE